MKKKLIIILYIAIILLLAADSCLFYAKKDFSRDKTFSLSDVTLKILELADEKVQITYYVSDSLNTMYPSVKDIKEFLKTYASASKNVYTVVKDPQKNSMSDMLTSLGIYPQQIQTTENNKTSFLEVFSAVTIEYKGNTEVIPFVLSTMSLEYDIDSRLKYLITRIPRQAALLCGNGLSLEADYKYLIPWLESSGFVCTQIAAEDLPQMSRQIPLVVIGASLLTPDDVLNIENFVMSGGNAAFCVSSNDVEIYTDWSVSPVKNNPLLELIDFWGIKVCPEMLLDISNDQITMQTPDGSQIHNEYINYPFWIVSQYSGVSHEHPITVGYSGLEFYWPSPLELFETDTLSIKPIFNTSPGAWLLKKTQDGFDTNPFSVNIPDESTKGTYTIAAALEGKVSGFYNTGKSQDVRLFVVGDQYLVSNMIEYTNSPHNQDFFTNVILWLSKEDALLSIRGKGMSSSQLVKITDEQQFMQQKTLTITVCFVLLPLLVVVVFIIVFILRKRFNNE